jgi:hypothetical protein
MAPSLAHSLGYTGPCLARSSILSAIAVRPPPRIRYTEGSHLTLSVRTCRTYRDRDRGARSNLNPYEYRRKKGDRDR